MKKLTLITLSALILFSSVFKATAHASEHAERLAELSQRIIDLGERLNSRILRKASRAETCFYLSDSREYTLRDLRQTIELLQYRSTTDQTAVLNEISQTLHSIELAHESTLKPFCQIYQDDKLSIAQRYEIRNFYNLEISERAKLIIELSEEL